MTVEEFEKQYEDFFKRGDMDDWEVRKAMSGLLAMDLLMNPTVTAAGLQACRRINDIALAFRWLEGIRHNCGDHEKEFYPYITQEIKPTLTELGIFSPKELGYDKPELALQRVDEI